MTIDKKELNINNIIETYHYVGNLIDQNQLTQWFELYEQFLINSSIEHGQPLVIFAMIEYNNLDVSNIDLFNLSTNFINRVKLFLNFTKRNNIDIHDKDRLFNYLHILDDNPLNIDILDKLFVLYINEVFNLQKEYRLIGMNNYWKEVIQ